MSNGTGDVQGDTGDCMATQGLKLTRHGQKLAKAMRRLAGSNKREDLGGGSVNDGQVAKVFLDLFSEFCLYFVFCVGV